MRHWLAIAIVVMGCGSSKANDLFGSNPGVGGMPASGGGGLGGTATGATGGGGSGGGAEAGTTSVSGSGGRGGTSGSGGTSGGGGTSGMSGSGGASGDGGDGGAAGGAGAGGAAPSGGGAGGEAGSGEAGAGGEGGAEPCTPTGDERCDGRDNDCAGGIDDGDVCPAGCYGFADESGHGYMVCLADETFEEAQDACQAHDPDFNLVIIEGPDGQAENDFLVASLLSLTSANTDFWIGATDGEDEDAWFWLDGTQFYDHDTEMTVDDGWENWADDRPNDLPPGEDCAALVVNDPEMHGQWNDLPCDDTEGYICEASDQ